MDETDELIEGWLPNLSLPGHERGVRCSDLVLTRTNNHLTESQRSYLKTTGEKY